MRRRDFLASFSAVGLSSTLAACSEQYNQFVRERKYPTVEKDLIQNGTEYISDAPNSTTTLSDMRDQDSVEVSLRKNILHPTFNPHFILVTTETEIQWTHGNRKDENEDYSTHHQIQGINRDFNSDVLRLGDTYTYIVQQEGLLKYNCRNHKTQNMKGAIIIVSEE